MKNLVNDEFYLGYIPDAPRALGRIVTRIAAGILLAGTTAGALLIFNQPSFAPSRFESGEYRDYEGVMEEWPYPSLVTDSASFFLVAPGKYGVTEAVRGLQGKSIRLKGSLIERAPEHRLNQFLRQLHIFKRRLDELQRALAFGHALDRALLLIEQCDRADQGQILHVIAARARQIVGERQTIGIGIHHGQGFQQPLRVLVQLQEHFPLRPSL